MLTRLFIVFIGIYQKILSPLKPKVCRFHPSCSEYAKVALKKKGFLKGSYITLKRLAKCHPFHTGGYDPVP